MDIHCARCGCTAVPAGHEDARAFYQCENCNRVWMVHLTAAAVRSHTQSTRVLVVDDADSLVALVEMWLEDEGYDVVTATSGRHAIDALESHDPDIVLLDLIIPPPDGLAVCRAIQRRPRAPEVIVMTGTMDPLRLHEAREAGIFMLLLKPLTQELVLDAVSRARRNRWANAPRATVQ
jgi:two-component system KDP operon response regulator KdpE